MALSPQTQRGRRNHLPSPSIQRLFEGRCDGGDARIQAAAAWGSRLFETRRVSPAYLLATFLEPATGTPPLLALSTPNRSPSADRGSLASSEHHAIARYRRRSTHPRLV